MKRYIKTIQLFLFSLALSIAGFAQDKKELDVNISTDKGNDNFWGQPWVWVVGAALFVLLLVALLRSNRSTE